MITVTEDVITTLNMGQEMNEKVVEAIRQHSGSSAEFLAFFMNTIEDMAEKYNISPEAIDSERLALRTVETAF